MKNHMILSCIKGAAALVVAAGAVGCGGIGPGDYVIYRVALGAPSYADDCMAPDDVKNDSTTFRDSENFILYAGPEDEIYLDVGATTLSGVEEGDGYKFTGNSVDVTFLGVNDKSTQEVETTVTMTVDGSAVSGSIKSRSAISYACADPATCPTNTSCTQTIKYVGAEIEDVDLEHDPG